MIQTYLIFTLQLLQSNIALYMKYTLGLEKEYPFYILGMLVATVCWLPLVQLVIVKSGKRTAFVVGMWVFMPALLLMLYNFDFFTFLFYPGILFGALGVATAYLLPW